VKLTGYLEVGARAGRNHGGGATLTRRGAQIQGYPTREGGSDKSIGDNRMTRAEYDGDNPLRLADEIDAALTKYGLGSDRRMCKAIHFFEGELRLIAECLRCAGPQKVAKQPRGSTDGVATQEEIEKYLKQLKRMQTAA
jgi:hypothetical protein